MSFFNFGCLGLLQLGCASSSSASHAAGQWRKSCGENLHLPAQQSTQLNHLQQCCSCNQETYGVMETTARRSTCLVIGRQRRELGGPEDI